MSELIFESSLSMEEIEENFKNVDFFSSLIEGLEEALLISRERKGACKHEQL